MLVIADEPALGIGREGRLARARKSEEERRVTVRPHVGRAVHGKHAVLRHQVVHHREDGLLQLAGVARSADEDHAALEAEHDERTGARSVDGRIRLHLRRVQHREVGEEGLELRELRADEHVPHERGLPCVRRDVADRQAVLRVRTRIQVLHEQLALRIQVRPDVRQELVEVLGCYRAIHRAPVHVVLRTWLLDHELVVWRAARVRRCYRHEGTHLRKPSFLPTRSALHQFRRDEVPPYRSARHQTLKVQAVLALAIG